LQAAVLGAFLPGLDALNARRRQIAAIYSEGISHPQVTKPSGRGEAYVAHLYVVRTAARESLRAHLKAQGIASDVHYPVCDHRQRALGDRFEQVRLPVSEALSAEVLTLPCYPEMTDAQVAQVVQAVNGWAP